MTVTASASGSISPAQALSVAVAVASSAGAPAGSVVLSSGNYASFPFSVSGGQALVSVPAGLRDHRAVETRTLFEACVGRAFVVTTIEAEMAELEVGNVLGVESGSHTIWVDRKYLKLSPN